MTKTLIKAALAATVATGLFASPAMAADSETFTATARIVSPLTLTLTPGSSLNFGTITKLPLLSVAGETVSVGRIGGGSNACGTNLACTGARTPALFSVTGSADQGLTVTTSALSDLTSGSDTVPFVIDAPGLGEVVLDNTGATTFQIGGSITVSSATPDGTYTGNVDVTVEYS